MKGSVKLGIAILASSYFWITYFAFSDGFSLEDSKANLWDAAWVICNIILFMADILSYAEKDFKKATGPFSTTIQLIKITVGYIIKIADKYMTN